MMDWFQNNLPEDIQPIVFWVFRLIIGVVISYFWAKHYLDRQKREVEEAERMMQEQQNDQDEE